MEQVSQKIQYVALLHLLAFLADKDGLVLDYQGNVTGSDLDYSSEGV